MAKKDLTPDQLLLHRFMSLGANEETLAECLLYVLREYRDDIESKEEAIYTLNKLLDKSENRHASIVNKWWFKLFASKKDKLSFNIKRNNDITLK